MRFKTLGFIICILTGLPVYANEIYFRVNVSDQMNVRAAPSTKAEKISIQLKNDCVVSDGQTVEQEGYVWYKIISEPSGWAVSKFLQKSAGCKSAYEFMSNFTESYLQYFLDNYQDVCSFDDSKNMKIEWLMKSIRDLMDDYVSAPVLFESFGYDMDISENVHSKSTKTINESLELIIQDVMSIFDKVCMDFQSEERITLEMAINKYSEGFALLSDETGDGFIVAIGEYKQCGACMFTGLNFTKINGKWAITGVVNYGE